MTQGFSYLLLTSMLACLFSVIVGTHYPPTVYVTDYCSNVNYVVSSDARLMLSHQTYTNGVSNCQIILIPSRGNYIKARFRDYDMPFPITSGNCTYQYIQLYDNNGVRLFPGYPQYCRGNMPSTQYVFNQRGRFQYAVVYPFSTIAATADLLVTEFVYKYQSPNSTCPADYFDCQNTLCIPEDVICNGYDDCGNNKDEIEGCGLTPGAIAGVVIGVLIFLAILIVLSVLFRRHRRRAMYIQQY